MHWSAVFVGITLGFGLSACSGGDEEEEHRSQCLIEEVALCDTNATCSIVDDVAVCECEQGFRGNGVSCEDIDECEVPEACAGDFETCQNTEGSFRCECAEGFVSGDGGCEDVDECAEISELCGEHSVCTNVAGSYQCECQEGYLLSEESEECEGDPETLIADLGDTPVQMRIVGVGSYLVHRMGQIRGEITYTSVPASQGLTHTPTGHSYSTVVLQQIEASGNSSLSALRDWLAVSANSDLVELTIPGAQGERITVNVVVDSFGTIDPTIADDALAGFEVIPREFGVSALSYTPPTQEQSLANETSMEISGIGNYRFLDGDISEVNLGEFTDIRLHRIRNVDGGNAGSLLQWWDQSKQAFEDKELPERRDLSVVPMGNEPDRVNCFSVFPTELRVFNPVKPYLESNLIELGIAREFCAN